MHLCVWEILTAWRYLALFGFHLLTQIGFPESRHRTKIKINQQVYFMLKLLLKFARLSKRSCAPVIGHYDDD